MRWVRTCEVELLRKFSADATDAGAVEGKLVLRACVGGGKDATYPVMRTVLRVSDGVVIAAAVGLVIGGPGGSGLLILWLWRYGVMLEWMEYASRGTLRWGRGTRSTVMMRTSHDILRRSQESRREGNPLSMNSIFN